jgi:hypothetical protein
MEKKENMSKITETPVILGENITRLSLILRLPLRFFRAVEAHSSSDAEHESPTVQS